MTLVSPLVRNARSPSRSASPGARVRPVRAFTLIELLVAVTIMGILASIALLALAGVQESAKGDKTRATIAKLSTLVMAKYESYRTRRVPVDVKAVANNNNYAANIQGWAEARVDVIRELMRMEMPDRYSDILDDPVTKMKDAAGNVTNMPAPSVTQAYRNVYQAAHPSSPIMAYESAKCLYLLISHGLDDPDVMQLFGPDEIATDSRDSMRYFVDGWGQPIFFIRWAPGFQSPLQPWNVNPTDALNNPNTNKTYPTTADSNDPLQMYKPTVGDLFYNPATTTQMYPPLYPLIYSAGPDRIFDIFVNTDPDFHYSTTTPPNNPYVPVVGALFGAPTDQSSDFSAPGVTTGDGVDNSLDNITNQDSLENQ